MLSFFGVIRHQRGSLLNMINWDIGTILSSWLMNGRSMFSSATACQVTRLVRNVLASRVLKKCCYFSYWIEIQDVHPSIILFRAAPNIRWPHLSLYAVCYIDICYMFSTTTACSSIVLLLFRIFLTGLSWPWLYVFLQLPLQSVHMITTKVVSSNDVHGEVVFDITTLCDKVCQWLVTDQWFYLGTMVSSINKTDRHDITEILLKVALNPINQTRIF
jgi:hypothetical protein